MPRNYDVFSVLVDILLAPNTDEKENFECNKTEYRDKSIQPVFSSDPQLPKQCVLTDPLLS